MSHRYQSWTIAVADQALAVWYRLQRQGLTYPHACTKCYRTVSSVPAMETVTAAGVPCRRLTWIDGRCPGRLVRAVTR